MNSVRFMPFKRSRGRSRTLTEEHIDELLGRFEVHETRLRHLEATQAKILRALIVIAAELPILIAAASTYLKSGH